METKIIKLGKQEVSHSPFRVSLTDRRDGQSLSKNKEISAIKIHNANFDMIDKVSIYIGGTEVFSFEGNEINNIVLPEEGILLSKCAYHCVDIYFHFNKQFIKNNSKYRAEEEYDVEEVQADELVSVRHPETGEVYSTNVIKIIRKPTGRKTEILVSGPEVDIPQMEFTLRPMCESDEKIIESSIWQKYLVTPEYDKWEYIQSLVDRFQLKMADGKSVEEYYKKDKPFYARIQNKLRYCNGFAGLSYMF